MARRVIIGLCVVMVLGTVVLVPFLAGGTKPAERELVLVARDMSFHLADQAPDNPVIRVVQGQNLRLVLRNEDEGITHDLAVLEWGVGVHALRSGSTGVLSVRVPDEPGRVEYICQRHGALMKGTIEIAAQ